MSRDVYQRWSYVCIFIFVEGKIRRYVIVCYIYHSYIYIGN